MANKNSTDDFDAFLASLEQDTSSTNDLDLDGLLAALERDTASSQGFDGMDTLDFPTEGSNSSPAPQSAPQKRSRDAFPPPKEPPKKALPKKEPPKAVSRGSAETGSTFISRNHRVINLVLLAVAVLLAAGIVAVVFLQTNSDPYNGRMMDNIRIAGVDVGGMTKQEAANAVSTVTAAYRSDNMTVVMGKDELILPASQAAPGLDISAAVEAAYSYGRTGDAAQRQADYQNAKQSPVDIPIGDCLTMNTEYVRSTVASFIQTFAGTYTPSGYTLEGTRPGLDADSFNASVPCQNLVLTIGTPGSQYDMDGILSSIAAAYGAQNFRVVIPAQYLPQMPDALDIDAIYQEVHVDAVEAVPDSASGEGTPGSCGYTFSKEDARQLLENATYGDVISVPMEYVIPQKLDNNGTFTSPLASYTTPVSSNEAYNQNLEKLCTVLNGTTVDAGQTFSFDTVLGKRTESDGYQLAPSHGDQCLETEIAGGSDQVATTLYVAAMSSGMTIVEHSVAPHVCPYTTKGTEVTVSDWRDLKFRNPLSCRVMIRAKVTDGLVVVRLLSEKDVDYEVKMDIQQLSTTQPGTVNVEKRINEGYKALQVLTEGSEGGQFRINWIKFKKGTSQEISRVSEYVILPALNRATVVLYG